MKIICYGIDQIIPNELTIAETMKNSFNVDSKSKSILKELIIELILSTILLLTRNSNKIMITMC